MYALDSLRLEKGYLGWKGDITTEFTPLETGLDRFVSLGKPAFAHKAALLARRDAAPGHKLVLMSVEGTEIDAPYGSLILRGGAIVGFTTSAGYGHRTGMTLALGYVKAEFALAGAQFDVQILGRISKATMLARPPYDPDNHKLRA
jgi:dimethylglycine dehydrogenase